MKMPPHKISLDNLLFGGQREFSLTKIRKEIPLVHFMAETSLLNRELYLNIQAPLSAPGAMNPAAAVD